MTTAACSPASGAADPDRTGPALRFLGGVPSAEEIAAVTAALLSLRRAPADYPEAGRGVAPRWSAPLHYRSPGSWAAR
ncbi:acyl-CoA carboxylase epsilon subunit [Streptomyces poriferorum]|uniref:Acyl-CoA carboxylase epsilon subunit n=1 Tax=Streptomyces poriferorum TaxID=2798799 RepID=A0ABY9IPJ5_9ACTN|nr:MULTISPECIES: acyl-CoA carboxylase epsilon subunit [unclassified Streptomyces]MDP5314846.1 acyl-CoA carboxylase epsilon subunit [Streptomyces sp. Alt4]WLQ56264.1 acyl-CoA carboxylase epsilon subunit [Streptomyces sp. Alt2]